MNINKQTNEYLKLCEKQIHTLLTVGTERKSIIVRNFGHVKHKYSSLSHFGDRIHLEVTSLHRIRIQWKHV